MVWLRRITIGLALANGAIGIAHLSVVHVALALFVLWLASKWQ